ncbi:MAG TPA: NlpC/P60 family protein [Streptosporangiaceae bacterium]|nr:NlpC/P60 family protein [Streptosporangiaceae bacterium]
MQALFGCGLLTLPMVSAGPAASAATAASATPAALVSGPPTAAQVGAAAGQVSRRRAQLGATQRRLTAANAQLAALQTQSEVLTERYDETLVNEQRAKAAYQVTESRLAAAERAERSSQRRVAGLAAAEYEAGGGVGSTASMLGDASGPDAYLKSAGLSQVLAQYGTDALAENQASKVVAGVFRAQAHDLLIAEQADVRAANDLKLAIQAEVARQLRFVRADRDATSQARTALSAAQARVEALQAARQAALAAAAARQAAAAARRAAAAGGPSTTVQAPSWAYGSGASATQGDVAANWALSQLGKPYLWGGAGPDAYDCSGLTMQAWARAGVQLLHWTGYQWIEGPHVPLGNLQRGDLVFYATDTSDPATIHHVGIYIGNGMMVDAPYTGAFVRIDSIYDPGLIGAVRPAN